MADILPRLGVPFGPPAGEVRKGDTRLSETTFTECLHHLKSTASHVAPLQPCFDLS